MLSILVSSIGPFAGRRPDGAAHRATLPGPDRPSGQHGAVSQGVRRRHPGRFGRAAAGRDRRNRLRGREAGRARRCSSVARRGARWPRRCWRHRRRHDRPGRARGHADRAGAAGPAVGRRRLARFYTSGVSRAAGAAGRRPDVRGRTAARRRSTACPTKCESIIVTRRARRSKKSPRRCAGQRRGAWPARSSVDPPVLVSGRRGRRPVDGLDSAGSARAAAARHAASDAASARLHAACPSSRAKRAFTRLRGTRVALAGTSTKKLRAARPSTRKTGRDLPASLTDDAYGFALAADAEPPLWSTRPGTYWIELEDIEGLAGGTDEQFEIRAVADWNADRDDRATVGQHLRHAAGRSAAEGRGQRRPGHRQHRLAFQSLGPLPTSRTLPYRCTSGPAQAQPREERGPAGRRTLGRKPRDRTSLAAGRLEAQTRAAGDVLGPRPATTCRKTGKSTVRKLTIITPQSSKSGWPSGRRWSSPSCSAVLKMQQDARGPDAIARNPARRGGPARQAGRRPGPVGRTQSAAGQRARSPAPTEGIPAQIADFLADLANNRVDSPDLERHMRADSRGNRPAGPRASRHDRTRADRLDQGRASCKPPTAQESAARPAEPDPLAQDSRWPRRVRIRTR